MLLNLHFMAVMLLLCGFSESRTAEQVYLGQKFILGPNQQVSIIDSTAGGETLTLTWDNLLDSRCPSDVTCVTAGEAVLSLQLNNNLSQTLPVKLQQPGTSPTVSVATGTVVQLGQAKYSIRLFSVSPYPTTQPSIRIPQAELVLEKITS